MSSDNIASQLLHSSDVRIAEAAKRVFSSAFPSIAESSGCTRNPPPFSPSFQSISALDDGRYEQDYSSTATLDGIPRPSRLPEHHGAGFSASITDVSGLIEGAVNDSKDFFMGPSSSDRLQRSRERNRLHARKTRQRKKEHMQKLQSHADELKMEQIRLKQIINEKNTATILVRLYQSDGKESNGCVTIDPRIDVLLKRPTDEIPDSSKIPDLPALILPGQHTNKNKLSDCSEDIDGENITDDVNEDGIDYALLGKDRSSCSSAELDQIRRERNRMHAKRTRDRKRIFMEEMEGMIRQLEEENTILQDHVNKINGNLSSDEASSCLPKATSKFGTGDALSIAPNFCANLHLGSNRSAEESYEVSSEQLTTSHIKGDFLNQIESLLAAAGTFERSRCVSEINAISCAESEVTASTNDSEHNSLCEEDDNYYESKKQRISTYVPTTVPSSITTTKLM